MKKLMIIGCLFFVIFATAKSQNDEVHKNLRLYAHGKIDEVKNNLLDLLVEYPNDPGVILLRGVVENDAYKAFEIYKKLIRDYPKSEWADYAYWRIIQFYAITGDIKTAKNELELFRGRYPTSVFLGTATDLVRAAEGLSGDRKHTSGSQTESTHTDRITRNEIDNTAPQKQEIPSSEGIANRDIVVSNPQAETRETENIEEVDNSDNINDSSESVDDDESMEESGFWGLQVGIYSNLTSAEKERDRFLTKRLRTKVEEKEINGKTMYAVVIGNYTSESSAEAAKMIVKQQCECDPIIYKK